jgi:hypothetical protein
MAIDMKKLNQRIEAVVEKEKAAKKEKANLMKQKRKAAREQKAYTFELLGEILFENFKVDYGTDFTASKKLLIDSIGKSNASEDKKNKLSDLVRSGILSFERAKPRKEK